MPLEDETVPLPSCPVCGGDNYLRGDAYRWLLYRIGALTFRGAFPGSDRRIELLAVTGPAPDVRPVPQLKPSSPGPAFGRGTF